MLLLLHPLTHLVIDGGVERNTHSLKRVWPESGGRPWGVRVVMDHAAAVCEVGSPLEESQAVGVDGARALEDHGDYFAAILNRASVLGVV